MRLILAPAVVLILATLDFLSPAQTSHQSTKNSFTSPDGAFRFEYPDTLVSCKRDSNQLDRWAPESCEAFTPVCSDVYGDSDDTVACVAYPASEAKENTSFQAAAFSVSQMKRSTTDSECLRIAEPPPHVGTSHNEMINGTKFSVSEVDGVATGNLINGYAYRTFHRNKCYELDIRIAFSNSGNANPGTLKNFNIEKVRHRLDKVLRTFKVMN